MGREGKGMEGKGREGLGDVFFFFSPFFSSKKIWPLFCRGPHYFVHPSSFFMNQKKRVFSFRRKAKQSIGEIVVEEIAG